MRHAVSTAVTGTSAPSLISSIYEGKNNLGSSTRGLQKEFFPLDTEENLQKNAAFQSNIQENKD